MCLELTRRCGDYALVGVAARAVVDGGRVSGLRAALFGVGATPVPAREASRAADGAPVAEAARAAADALGRDLDPPGDPTTDGAARLGLVRAAAPRGGGHGGVSDAVRVALSVNGEAVTRAVDPRMHLVDFLRGDLGLTGSHLGCEHGVCGACTVRVDGQTVRGCLLLAAQADGATVETVEGLAADPAWDDLRAAFVDRNVLQCGYCTPGMLASAAELLAAGGVPTRDTIRDHLSGNYCRCAGYHTIARPRRGALRMSPRPPDDTPPALLHAVDRPNSWIGRARPREQAKRHAAGGGRFLGDLESPRCLRAAFSAARTPTPAWSRWTWPKRRRGPACSASWRAPTWTGS